MFHILIFFSSRSVADASHCLQFFLGIIVIMLAIKVGARGKKPHSLYSNEFGSEKD